MRDSPPKLLVHPPEKPPKEYLFQQTETVIGRDPACHLPLDDRKISRTHARILDRQGTFTIRDLGSRNGTYVNDDRIGPEDGEVSIGDQDRIRVGNHIIQCVMPGIPSSRQAVGAREREKTRIAKSISEHLLDPPTDASEETDEEVEWPPVPDMSPGDELETGVIKRSKLKEAIGAAESVDLDLQPVEVQAIQEGAAPAEEAVGEGAPGAEEQAGAEGEASSEGEAPAETPSEADTPVVGEVLEDEVAPKPETEGEGSKSGDTSLLSEVTSDTSYDIMADLEDLREARARLIIANEEDGAESLPLERRRITIGRGRHNDVVISHHTVSSAHAEIQFGPDGFVLVDKNSTNGTYIDNARIRSGRLRDGAYVMFGGVMALFLHEKGFDEESSREEATRVSEALVRLGVVQRPRVGEAMEKAKAPGLRLSEVLILEGDITPAQWWEASRLADPARPRSNRWPAIVTVLVVLALVVAAVVFFVLFPG